MSPDELAAALHRGAEGDIGGHAAADMVIGHPTLLARIADLPDLFTVGIAPIDAPAAEQFATVDWHLLGDRIERGRIPLSSGEAGYLSIACALGSGWHRIALGDAVDSLDAGNLRLVLRAIAVAAGKPEVFPR